MMGKTPSPLNYKSLLSAENKKVKKVGGVDFDFNKLIIIGAGLTASCFI